MATGITTTPLGMAPSPAHMRRGRSGSSVHNSPEAMRAFRFPPVPSPTPPPSSAPDSPEASPSPTRTRTRTMPPPPIVLPHESASPPRTMPPPRMRHASAGSRSSHALRSHRTSLIGLVDPALAHSLSLVGMPADDPSSPSPSPSRSGSPRKMHRHSHSCGYAASISSSRSLAPSPSHPVSPSTPTPSLTSAVATGRNWSVASPSASGRRAPPLSQARSASKRATVYIDAPARSHTELEGVAMLKSDSVDSRLPRARVSISTATSASRSSAGSLLASSPFASPLPPTPMPPATRERENRHSMLSATSVESGAGQSDWSCSQLCSSPTPAPRVVPPTPRRTTSLAPSPPEKTPRHHRRRPTAKIEDKLMEQRHRLAVELLESERRYVDGLNLIQEFFYKPLYDAACRRGGHGHHGSLNILTSDSGKFAFPLLAPREHKGEKPSGVRPSPPALSRPALNEMFSNFSQILHLNSELLALLEQRVSPPGKPPWNPAQDEVGDILVSIAPYLKLYLFYVKNFSAALERIEHERRVSSAFATFLRDAETLAHAHQIKHTPSSKPASSILGLGLQSFLLSIVQRIPRYKLLVEGLVKNTPSTLSDYSHLQAAQEVIQSVAAGINESVRQHEASLVLLAVQRALHNPPFQLVTPGRTLLRSGVLGKSTRRAVQERTFFLFSDCLLYAAPVETRKKNPTWSRLAQYLLPTPPAEPERTAFPDEFGVVWTAPAAHDAPSFDGGVRGLDSSIRTSGEDKSEREVELAPHSLVFRAAFDLRDIMVVNNDPMAPLARRHDRQRQASIQGSSVSGSVSSSISSIGSMGSPSASRHHSVSSMSELVGVRHAFEIRTPSRSFVLYAADERSKERWISAIRDAKQDYLTARRTLNQSEEVTAHRKHVSVSSIEALRARRHSLLSLPSLPSGTAVSPTPTPVGPPKSTPSSPPSSPLAGTATQPLPILEEYNAPIWIPDNHATMCSRCQEPFTLFRRKHHCRLCGQIVCSPCSSARFLIPFEMGGGHIAARACQACFHNVFDPLPPVPAVDVPDLGSEWGPVLGRSLDPPPTKLDAPSHPLSTEDDLPSPPARGMPGVRSERSRGSLRSGRSDEGEGDATVTSIHGPTFV